MKIKDIKEYRSFYKSVIRDLPTRDENFIGNFLVDKEDGKKKFGWFEIYHGDKEGYGKAESGIENFLQSFLDMAKDGQAVYEFLQNAVDSGSTHFSMVWGKDEIDGNHYLLVANNGKMFNLDSVRSILNVGSSTKTNDSQTIGKFGIGFKLAHRLVGKDNGLQELINENSGPILFSWKNYEIDALANTEKLEPENLQYINDENGNYLVEDDNPWLFKILITCFPCLPQNDIIDETLKMANGEQAAENPFSHSEYETLSRWVRNNQKILNKETYSEGALFFLKLGSGKEEELAEVNLNKGVKFAIAILKETSPDDQKNGKVLNTVQLNNDDTITYPELEYIKIIIDKEKEKDTYAYIRFGVESFENLINEQKRRITDEAHIEALFGFRKYNNIDDYFKGAPNFYLYFPLSEEVHNFNYILHSNAFYKGSSRTFLHAGNTKEDGINERLLKVLVDKIDLKLNELSNSQSPSDKALFLDFYAALLTSAKSDSQYRFWIDNPYLNPVNSLLIKYIPIRKLSDSGDFVTLNKSEQVFVKKTNIAIDTDTWGLKNVNWYYWNSENEDITTKSIKKLEIKEYTIFDLLANEGIDIYINKWLEGDEKKIKLVLKELSEFDGNSSLINQIRPQLIKLKLFRFSNNELLSLSMFIDKESAGYFLLQNTLADVKELLIKAGLVTTEINLSEYKFVEIYRTYLLQASKHRGYTDLTQLFSQAASDENLVKLSKDEKLKLFNAFRTISPENITERIKELKLFNNNIGKPTAFKSLLVNKSDSWLNIFSISEKEYDQQLKLYLLDDTRDFYKNIIYPHWSDILRYIGSNQNTVKDITDEITSLFSDSTWGEKQQHLLSNQDLIIYNSQVIKSEYIYINKSLIVITDPEYAKVQEITYKLYKFQIPDKYLLNFIGEIPFSYSNSILNTSIDSEILSIEDVDILMLFTSNCNIDFFEDHTIFFRDNKYIIDSNSNIKQFSCFKSPINNYISKYYSDQLVLIPEDINIRRGQIKLSDATLVTHLVELFNENNIEQELELIELVLNERYEDKKTLLDNLTFLKLDTNWVEQRQNELYLKLLNDVFIESYTSEEIAKIQEKILVYDDELEITIGKIDSAQDTIEVKREDKTIYLSQSEILNLDNAHTIKLVQAFHDIALSKNLIHPAKADHLFKISKVGISEDLINRFENNLKILKTLKNALPINNAHQLSFVLLSGKYKEDDLKKFAVKCDDNKWYFLQDVKVIYSEINKKFIDSSILLNECYSGLQSLLSLNDTEVFNFGESEENILVSKFLFVKGITPGILKERGDTPEQLDYLYNGWKSLPGAIRDNKRNADWEQFLGLSPNQYIFNGICSEDEILPVEFTNWCQNDKSRQEFFKAIGINVNDSYIQEYRLFLLNEKNSYPSDRIDAFKFNTTLLLHTLNGISGDFISLNNSPFIYLESEHSAQIQEIERIIFHLVENEIDCPLLVYNNLDSYVLVKQEDFTVCKIEEAVHHKLKQDNHNNLQLIYSDFYVVKDSLLISDIIKKNTLKIIFKKEFQESVNSEIHQEPFYHNWSKQNNIILIKEDQLKFKIYYEDEDGKKDIGTIVDGDYYQNKNEEDITVINYSRNIHLDGLKSYLEYDQNPIASFVADLISKRDAMLASIYNAYNSASKDDVNSEHLKALQEAFREENLKQERNDLLNDIKKNTKYSYKWFVSYLDYMLTFSKNSADNSKQKKIRFHTLKRQLVNNIPSNKYFLLCGASSYISDSIEDISDFTLSVLLKNNKRFDLSVEGAQKQGQDLLIFCPKGINKEITQHFDLIFQLEITFIPQIDLLKELKNALSNNSNIDNWEDIYTELPSLNFIYGPPGTGKTTTLCSEIIDEVKLNPNAKYLFLTPTNKASDVLCKKLLISAPGKEDIITLKMKELKDDNIYLSVNRIGKPTDPEIEALELDIYQDSIEENVLASANVIAMTIHRLPYTKTFNSSDDSEIKLFKLRNHWDFVVFDEASMINLPYLIFAILSIKKFNPHAKFIIAGDPKQIPPVVDINDKELEELDIQNENIYSMMKILSFDEQEQKQVLRVGDKIKNLKVQYRSVKKIGQLFSELSYNKLLEHHRELKQNNSKKLPIDFEKIIDNNVVLIDIPLNNEDSIYKIRQLFYSSYHVYSAILISEIIKYFDECLTEGDSWSIGLIAPYKAQAVLMNKLIASFGISDKLKIYADTVHGFQGDECDIVFFISNPNNYYYTGNYKSLLSKEYIYNVAISRAKDYLVILHPFSVIPDNPFINNLKNSYKSNFGNISIQKSHDLENILFKDRSFIYDNSYITGHDTVNVFGQLEKKYFIKANSSAIDIQLRKL